MLGFLLFVLACYFQPISYQKAIGQNDYPSDGYFEDDQLLFGKEQMLIAVDEVDWKIFPIIDKVYYPIEGRESEAFKQNPLAGFQMQNDDLDDEQTREGSCLYPRYLGEMWHLADDMFGDPGDLIQNTMIGRPIFHHLKPSPQEGYPGDALIIMHKLPNGKPIFTMLGHMDHGSYSNYDYTNVRSYPDHLGDDTNWYLNGGSNFTWVNEKNSMITGNVLIKEWGENTHIHWELRSFPNHEGLINKGYSTAAEYSENKCNYQVGPGYMPIDENKDANGKNLLPSDLGWQDPSDFLEHFNAGKYGRPVNGPSKQNDGITVCNKVNQCSLLPEGINIDPLLVADLDKVLIPSNFYLEFTENNDKVFCLNSEGENVRSYKYPDSMSKIIDATRSIFIRTGSCNNESGQLIKSDPLDGAGLFPRVWHCEKKDQPIVGVVGFNGEKFCYPVRVGESGVQRQGYTLGFPVKTIEVYGPPIQIYDQSNNCLLLKTTTEFAGTENFYRMVVLKSDDGGVTECQEYSGMDFPVVQYVSHFEGKSNTPAKLVWKTSKSATAPEYDQFMYVYHGFVLTDQILIPEGVHEAYLPDHGPGVYWFFMVTTPKDVPLNLAVDYLWWNAYEVVDTFQSSYVGFELNKQVFSFNVPEGVDLTIPPGQVGQLWGRSFSINGFEYGSSFSRSNASLANNGKYIFRLNPGEYHIENWQDGGLEVGTDYIGEYGEYLALANSKIFSETWQSANYEEFFVTPTATPTPTVMPITSATSTPVIGVTPTATSTVVPNPVASPTPTLTPTSTITVPNNDCPCIVLLPLIQHP